MTFVIDASVAVKWFIAEEESDKAAQLLTSSQQLIAPDFVIVEVCNAAWKLHRSGRIGAAQVDAVAARIGEFFAELRAARPLAARAAALARLVDMPVYDCFYVALAESESAQLIVDDAKLLAALRLHGLGSRVVSLMELRL